MKTLIAQFFVMLTGLLAVATAQAATDSYRFLHVTIETPWAIFLFLLVFIMIPFILMAMLYWYFAFKKDKEETTSESAASSTSPEKSAK